MRPQECMRLQGIGRRRLDKASPNKVREMVGNSMHVGTVSAVIRTAFKAMRNMTIYKQEVQAMAAKKLDDHVSPELDPKMAEPIKIAASLSQVHFQNFRLRRRASAIGSSH